MLVFFVKGLYFAQQAIETVCHRSVMLRQAKLASDKDKPIVIQVGTRSRLHDEGNVAPGGYYYVYVDNLWVIDTDRPRVEQALDDLQAIFNGLGLNLHKSEVGSVDVEALGCILDGYSKESRLNPSRLWRLRQGILALLRRGRCTGLSLEIIIGHCTSCALMFRPSLSIFNTVYSFIQASCYDVGPLWQTVRRRSCSVFKVSFCCSVKIGRGRGIRLGSVRRGGLDQGLPVRAVSERARLRRVGPRSARLGNQPYSVPTMLASTSPRRAGGWILFSQNYLLLVDCVGSSGRRSCGAPGGIKRASLYLKLALRSKVCNVSS